LHASAIANRLRADTTNIDLGCLAYLTGGYNCPTGRSVCCCGAACNCVRDQFSCACSQNTQVRFKCSQTAGSLGLEHIGCAVFYFSLSTPAACPTYHLDLIDQADWIGTASQQRFRPDGERASD
jgi:hypothetical protein